jgi:hypothetical protein
MAIWVIKDGQREGPYEEQDVRELIYEGTYGDADPAIRDGQYDWSTLGNLLGHKMPAFEAAAFETPVSSFQEAPPAEVPPQTAPEVAVPAPPPIPAAAPAQEPISVAPVPPAPIAPAQVAIVDFRMPFGSMLIFILKWMIAWLLAMMLLGFVAALFWAACLAILAIAFHQ